MKVAVGSIIGPYEILSPIGAGGMGEVWKARDTRLDRSVAIKFSHARFSERFEREARAIAQLNHPHICTLHDVGPDYLVMEYIEGESLDARLKRGAIPLAQTIRYGAQIAGALAAAHAKGIVHRDLKPGNIVLTKSGAKVLDFGLAKMPTLARTPDDETLTQENMVLGSPAYMAPEQRAGREADPRADIYALGLVLREMATGKRDAPLAGPPYFAHIVSNCLQEAAEDRWQSAADIQKQLEWSPPEAAVAKPSRMPWIFAIAALAALAAVVVWYRLQPSSSTGPMEFTLALEAEGISMPAPSPDGRLLAYRGAGPTGHPIIFLRPVNSLTPRPISGTEGAGSAIFWSPDGEWIGFHSAGAMRKIRATGGLPLKITDASEVQDADWNAQGDIIFRATNREPLQRVRDTGGAPRPLTKLNEALLENSHRFPKFLPGGRQFFFVTRCADRANNALYVGSLDSSELRKVMFVEARVAYVNGNLIYYRDGALVTQEFDLRSGQVRGDPRVIVSKVGYSAASIQAFFSVSNDGSAIIYSTADRVTSRLVWFDRNGQELGEAGTPGPYQQPRISPTADRVVFEMPDPKTGNRDLAFIELGRGIRHRLTNHPANDWYPVWSPDGKQVAFGSDRVDGRTMFAFLKTSLDLDAAETRIEGLAQPTDWSKDGWIATGNGKTTVKSIHGGEVVNLTASPGQEWAARFSPNARWLAYSSDESGRSEIYVRAFPGHPDPSSPKIQVSNNGGMYPMWDDTGAALFYMSAGDEVYSVDTRELAAGKLASPVGLFKVCRQTQPVNHSMFAGPYASPIDTRDGKKFLAACLVDPPGQYTVLLHSEPRP